MTPHIHVSECCCCCFWNQLLSCSDTEEKLIISWCLHYGFIQNNIFNEVAMNWQYAINHQKRNTVSTMGHQSVSSPLPRHRFKTRPRIEGCSKSMAVSRFPSRSALHILPGHVGVFFLKMETCKEEEEEREESMCRGADCGGKEKKVEGRRQPGQWHSRVTTWRHWQGVLPAAWPNCYHSQPPFPGHNPQRHRHYWVAAWCHNLTPMWVGDVIVQQWSVALRYWTHTHGPTDPPWQPP